MIGMDLLEIVAALVMAGAVLTFVPSALLLFQTLAAGKPRPDTARSVPGSSLPPRRSRVAVLVPAHDEADGIAFTLRSISCQLQPGDRLLVVADNCTDDTQSVASAHGAEAIARNNPALRGKGYAIDFGVKHLARNPPDTVIVVDADCLMQANALELLATACDSTGLPAQGVSLMQAPPGAGVRMRIAEFAWLVKNKVRPLGYARLNLPCHLMGTGVAFPWPIIHNAQLATGHIVEDMKLGLDLTEAGHPPRFCSEALVTSEFAVTRDAVTSQRTRWEHGHLGLITREMPRLMLRAIARRDLRLFSLALDLSVPPLALLSLVIAALNVAGAGLWAMGQHPLAFWIPLVCALLLVAAVALAWDRFGRQTVSSIELLSVPLYALNKLPIYLKFLYRKQVAWVRSGRGKR